MVSFCSLKNMFDKRKILFFIFFSEAPPMNTLSFDPLKSWDLGPEQFRQATEPQVPQVAQVKMRQAPPIPSNPATVNIHEDHRRKTTIVSDELIKNEINKIMDNSKALTRKIGSSKFLK